MFLTVLIDKLYYKVNMWKAGKLHRQVQRKQCLLPLKSVISPLGKHVWWGGVLLGNLLMKGKMLNGRKIKMKNLHPLIECMSTSWWVSGAFASDKVEAGGERTICTISGAPAPKGWVPDLLVYTHNTEHPNMLFEVPWVKTGWLQLNIAWNHAKFVGLPQWNILSERRGAKICVK